MRVLLLGSVAVVDRDRTHAITSHRQATVLASLAGRAGTTLAADQLIDEVWGAEAPATARNTLQVHVSGLRRLLGAPCIDGNREGYRFAGEQRDVDVLRFRALVRQGTNASAERPADAARLLRAALGLYRGDLLHGLPVSPRMDAERQRLRSLWTTAVLARFDADLAMGRHLLLVDELMALVRDRPLDEEVAARLMMAYYRSGAQAQALETYSRTAQWLRTELGVDPGPRLRELHQRILRHDVGLRPDHGTCIGWRVPLATPRDELVGRDSLLGRLESGIANGRLHTLVGPSGIGKTRLATELAARCQAWYRDGAVLVDLAGAATTSEVLTCLTRTLAGDLAAVPTDIEEQRRVVAESRALIVLDDFAPEATSHTALAELLASSRSGFVATSTRPTGLAGEHIWSVPPLTAEDGADLLFDRARQAGAVLAEDEETRAAAGRCANLLDGLPAAIELAAPLAVTGLSELEDTLTRRMSQGRDAVWVSFTSSLDRLVSEERRVLDLLSIAGAPVDAEVVEDAGGGDHLAALVRDGLVVRTLGSHGRNLYAVVSALAHHLAEIGDPVALAPVAESLVSALVRAVDAPDQYLVMQVADAARSRRLVALEPALVRGVELAHVHDLIGPAAGIAIVLPEVHFARYGVRPPAGVGDWLLSVADLDPGRRVDLLLSAAAMATQANQPDQTRELIVEAEKESRDLGDDGRLAMVLAQRSMSQLLLSRDLGDDVESRREAVRLALRDGRPEVVASTLGLLYPTAEAPADLADTLSRAASAARTSGHHGLLAFCLGNLSMAELEAGDVAGAAVHARESEALGRGQHHRALAMIGAEVAETAEVLTGSQASLTRLVTSLQLAIVHHELRRCAETLLRLAAGLHRLGRRAEASICLGIYEALLLRERVSATAAEAAFADTWLRGVVASPRCRCVTDEVAELVRNLSMGESLPVS